jgi:hypothetical protein
VSQVETVVNEIIKNELTVYTQEVPIEQAKKIRGIRAMFSEVRYSILLLIFSRMIFFFYFISVWFYFFCILVVYDEALFLLVLSPFSQPSFFSLFAVSNKFTLLFATFFIACSAEV